MPPANEANAKKLTKTMHTTTPRGAMHVLSKCN